MSLKDYSLNALRVFAVAANAPSFKHAAQQLELSQSAITRHIQTLEQQLGTPLFHRDNRVHALTPAGELLAPSLLSLFQQLEQTVEQARTCGDEELTTLRVLIPDTFLRWWLAPRLADFNAIYPHIRVQVDTYAEDEHDLQLPRTSQALQHGRIDVAVLSGKLKDRSLQQELLYQPTFSAIQSPADGSATPASWYINPSSEAWQLFCKQHKSLSQAYPLHAVAKASIGLDLLSSFPGFSLINTLYAQHPQFAKWSVQADAAVSAKTGVFTCLKARERHPVAVVAFSKWLSNRVQQSIASIHQTSGV
ncbi:LysR family transcriptional regulator [Pseudidiomarina terrestris]|uniref:LysR family transcriptional regulator n=1 Tax=Pseudidiomarina terrestris TaxID=2820060 RepID=A0AAW7QVE1_9GAMM|nr:MULTISPECIES: LysR family transcriptional regulator [unclassified Pseudidiomarina]MDN7123719.1 LysR family transcriptional regulator [Pseudidiomarina sp. 1APP75-32.1]MDN7128557.1 LysR family transcriptional regulator [Pseudidiomarina sp. 1APR75-15]MDN7135185.1 LysR family transcriptional regulator [Pseudidiomarina sp. 1ASP75-5]MEA3587038.1 LysR family transcriptional regulator [Pseudidiomarina sp. 1APP75-27a]